MCILYPGANLESKLGIMNGANDQALSHHGLLPFTVGDGNVGEWGGMVRNPRSLEPNYNLWLLRQESISTVVGL